MPAFDLAIKGATVIDGMRNPRFTGDIGVTDGVITRIGKVDSADAHRVLDARGLVLAPGFVDLHTHYDSQIYWDPWCTISGWHGVTSLVIGNCGFGFAPVREADRERAMLMLSRNEAVPMETMKVGMAWDWETYPEYLDSLERHPKGVNVLSYIGLSPIMAYVMGVEDAKKRRPTEAEMGAMCQILEEAMAAGACGFSAQLLGEGSIQRDYDGTPMITDTMAMDDLYKFSEVLGRLGRGVTQFTGGSYEVHEQVASITGRPVIYNLIAAGGRDQHGRVMENNRKTIDWINTCNAQGMRIFPQVLVTKNLMDFTLLDWNLFDSNPLWREFTLGSYEDKKARMQDESWRQRLRDDWDAYNAAGREAGRELSGQNAGPGMDISGLTVQNQAIYGGGYSVGEIAERRGCHVIDAFLDVTVETDYKAVYSTQPLAFDTAEMDEVVNSPFALPGVSDGGAHTKFLTNGAYPTEFLIDCVREHSLLSLEDAHWRLSGLPALAAGFRDRGTIREGSPADIVVYDYDALAVGPRERAYDFPADEWRLVSRAEGYRWIVVNGEVTFEDGECTGATPGHLLRHGSA